MEPTPEQLVLGLVWFVAFLFSTTLHEAAHALAAWRLGDPTAYEGGQVSLNPWPHLRREPFGMVLVPILSYLFYGWMMGWASAPYDPRWAQRHPRRSALMALAGPAANLLLVLAAGTAVRLGVRAGLFAPPDRVGFTHLVEATGGGAAAGLATLLSITLTLNLLLCVFNLLPLPPLDGAGALPLILPTAAAHRLMELLRQPMLALLGIVVAWRLIGELFWPLFRLALALLYPDVTYG